jgi:fatty-acid desaturase
MSTKLEPIATSIVSPSSHRSGSIDTVRRQTIIWRYLIVISLYHVVALFAFVPWFFSWTGVVLCLAGTYVFGTLGINLCFHRVLTHQGLVLPKWLEHTFAILGICCMQDTPARWVAIHRIFTSSAA